MDPGDESHAPPGAGAQADEIAAWDALVRRWEEEEAHRAYLARATDLDALAEAGRRYKAILDARPGDAVAIRWREEVVKRATAVAFASLPRGFDPEVVARRARLVRAVGWGLVAALFAVAGWLAVRLFPGGGR
jgi:hypothetical protein